MKNKVNVIAILNVSRKEETPFYSVNVYKNKGQELRSTYNIGGDLNKLNNVLNEHKLQNFDIISDIELKSKEFYGDWEQRATQECGKIFYKKEFDLEEEICIRELNDKEKTFLGLN
ncbi:MAG: hypothetical protein AABX88_03275 [Nanoarchaeota archaeon]